MPDDARGVVLFSPPGRLQPPVMAFLSGIEGKGGVFDWLKGKYGVDISTPEGLIAAGVSLESSVAMFQKDDVSVILVAAADHDDLETLVRDRLTALGYPPATIREEGDLEVRFVPSRADTGRPLVAWTFVKNLLVMGTADVEDPASVIAVLRGIAATPEDAPGYGAQPAVEEMARALPADAPGAFAYYDLSAGDGESNPLAGIFSPLGPLVSGMADEGMKAAKSLGVRFAATDDRISLTALLLAEEGAVATDWTKVDAPLPAFGDLLPRETTVLARARIDVGMIRDLPGFLREMVLPKGVLGLIHPLLAEADADADVLAHLTGNIAVALVGLDGDAALGSFVSVKRPSQAMRFLDGALFLQVHDAAAFRASWSRFTERATKLGWVLTESPPVAEGPPVLRLSHPKTKEHYAILSVDDVVVVVVGKAAYVDIRDVIEGRSTPLSARAETELAKRVVVTGDRAAAEKLTFGVFLSFARITRQLGEKGAPPFYLRVVNSIFEAALGVEVDSSSVRLSMEVVQ